MKLLIPIAVIVLLSASSSYADNKLILGRPDDPITEISARVLVKAYKRINIDIKSIELPAERSLLQSNSGAIDGEVNRVVGIDKKYTNLIMIPVSVNNFEAVVFSKKHCFTVNGWDSLKPYSIAIRLGIKFAEDGTRGMDVSKFVSNEKVFMLVSKNRFDICVSTRVTGLYQIKKQKLVGVKALEPPLLKYNLYHYLNKKEKDLVPKITASLQEMEREGAIKKERERYIAELLKAN